MLYIDPQGNYPRYYGDIMSATPDWNVGDPLPEGWQSVADAPSPEVGENELFFDGEPQVINGMLTRTYIIRPFNEQEMEAKLAPTTAKQKLIDLGFTEAEITAIRMGKIF